MDEQAIRENERVRIHTWLTDRAQSLFEKAAKLEQLRPTSSYIFQWRNMGFCLVLAADDIRDGKPAIATPLFISTLDLTSEELHEILHVNGPQPADETNPVVHIVYQGYAICGQVIGPLSTWPSSHRSVSKDERFLATCSGCIRAMPTVVGMPNIT